MPEDDPTPWWLRLDGLPPAGERRRAARVAAGKPSVGPIWPLLVLNSLVIGGGQVLQGHRAVAVLLWVGTAAAFAVGTLVGRALSR